MRQLMRRYAVICATTQNEHGMRHDMRGLQLPHRINVFLLWYAPGYAWSNTHTQMHFSVFAPARGPKVVSRVFRHGAIWSDHVIWSYRNIMWSYHNIIWSYHHIRWSYHHIIWSLHIICWSYHNIIRRPLKRSSVLDIPNATLPPYYDATTPR